VARSPGGPQTKTGESAMRSTDRSITYYKITHKKKSSKPTRKTKKKNK
jgi:hypothetical protein